MESLESFGMKPNHPDLLYLDDESKLGVEEGKLVRQHLSLKPYSAEKRVVILTSAHKLTPEAQNSLLKTLEEPPLASEIILGVEKLDNLLDTVISRCEVEYLDQNQELRIKNKGEDVQNFINKNTTDRFKQIEKMEERKAFLEELVEYYRSKLHSGDKNTVPVLEELLSMQQWIQSNVNDRAILEYAALVIPIKQ